MNTHRRMKIVAGLALSMLILLGCGIGPFVGGPTPMPSRELVYTATNYPTNTTMPTNTPMPTATPLPYAIMDAAFQEYDQTCSTDINITGVEGDSLKITVNTTITMLSGGWAVFCYGALHTWIGTLTYEGYTFASDESAPLQFTVDQYRGYVYVQGTGTVTLPDGTQVSLPGGSDPNAVTIFSADFNDSAFDGSFDPAMWTYQSDLPDRSAFQANGAATLTKPFAAGTGYGQLKTLQTWSLGEIKYIEARMMLDPERTGEMGNAGIFFGDLGCAVQIQGDNTVPFIWCAQSHTDSNGQWVSDAMSGSYFIEYGQWYTVRIAFNPQTNEVVCTIDGQPFFAWQPAELDALLGKQASVGVNIWAADGTALTASVDDLVIVK